jgi:hypothetical protein
MYVNSSRFEEILANGLQKKMELLLYPQKVAIFAQNVYIYFEKKEQILVTADLYFQTEVSQPYIREAGTFHSHAQCFSKTR